MALKAFLPTLPVNYIADFDTRDRTQKDNHLFSGIRKGGIVVTSRRY